MPINDESIQLLSGSRRKLEVKVPGENRPLFMGGIFLVAVGMAWGGLWYYFNSLHAQLMNLDNELSVLESSRDRKSEKDILAWEKRLVLAGKVVGDHLVWSEALSKIQAAVPSTVQFSTLSVNAQSEHIDIKATAPSYMVVAKHIAAFAAEPVFTEVSINKISGLPSGLLEYDLRVTFDRNKLLLGQTALTGEDE